MRPPYGATSDYINHWINREFGMKVILWSVDPLDWKYRNSARVERQILAGARPGAIILSHDIHATTVAAMPDVFDSLLAKGYKFVTVSELIAMDKPARQVAQREPSTSPAPP
jgi:peptidoglycan/xylan/chitin deacetylase (PgdA/CDA1 family)